MTEIRPRWEWRTFGNRFGAAESELEALPVEQVVESSELYVVSATGTGLYDEIVKVRGGLVDVKQLREINEDGLEQWRPVLKADFPLDAHLDEVVVQNPDVRAVGVHKRRVRYVIEGCLVELTDVRTDRGQTRTLAIESEDPSRVMGMMQRFGLTLRPNLNYERALRILEGFGAERFAVIDVGTNSVKFHVGDRDKHGVWRTVVDRAVVTRLGEGLRQSGELGAEPMARTREAIAGMALEAKRLRVGAIAAVGTAGLRIATNGAEFISDVEAECGVEIEVISGADEARLAYEAATADLGDHGVHVVFDTGGGSSQFTFGHADLVEERFSVEVGAVRFTEEFALDGVVAQETLDAALSSIAADLTRLDDRDPPDVLVAMGGAVTNLAAVKHALTEYDPDAVHGTTLNRADLDELIELFRSRTASDRREVTGLQPARAEVILAGACIVRTVLDKLGQTSLVVCDRGLRYGVLAEKFGLRDG